MSKIIRLTSSNVKRLKAIDITPNEYLVELAGNNAQGKSSILDSIMYALGGQGTVPSKVIRDGEDHAETIVVTEEFVIKRVYTQKGSYLKVINKDNFEAKSPQALLDSLVGKFTFDPIKFANQEPKEQYLALKKLAGSDFSDLEQQRVILTERRRLVGQEINKLKVFRQELGEPQFGLPDEEIDTQKIIDSITQVNEYNKGIYEKKRDLDSKIAQSTRLDDEYNHLQVEIKKLQERATQNRTNKNTLISAITELRKSITEPKDANALSGDLKIAQERNRAIQKNKLISKAQNELDDKQIEYSSYTGELDDIAKEIQTRINEAKYPIEGLTVNETEVLYNGIPLSQASQAETIKICMSIAAALNPTLRIVMIRDGSLLDKDSMKEVEKWAIENDYQVWVERVEPGTENAIIIEDGMVKDEKS